MILVLSPQWKFNEAMAALATGEEVESLVRLGGSETRTNPFPSDFILSTSHKKLPPTFKVVVPTLNNWSKVYLTDITSGLALSKFETHN